MSGGQDAGPVTLEDVIARHGGQWWITQLPDRLRAIRRTGDDGPAGPRYGLTPAELAASIKTAEDADAR